jgi:hypothetical protein
LAGLRKRFRRGCCGTLAGNLAVSEGGDNGAA